MIVCDRGEWEREGGKGNGEKERFYKSDGEGELWPETQAKGVRSQYPVLWVETALPVKPVSQEARRGQQRAGEQERHSPTCAATCSRNPLDSHHHGRVGWAIEGSWAGTGRRGMVTACLFIPRRERPAESKGSSRKWKQAIWGGCQEIQITPIRILPLARGLMRLHL